MASTPITDTVRPAAAALTGRMTREATAATEEMIAGVFEFMFF
jgi:hypothetical protein